jgi:hypothetical protein
MATPSIYVRTEEQIVIQETSPVYPNRTSARMNPKSDKKEQEGRVK